MYQLEKQAQRRTTPLSQAEMLRLYGQPKGQAPSLGARLGSAWRAVAQGFKAHTFEALAPAIVETK